jgi:hypothetical protein
MDPTLEKKLREMIDREEIWQVMLRYARGLDRLDVAMARSCYFDDATEDHGHFVGNPEGFVEWANQSTINYESIQHGLMNHFCELDGNDAHCETYFQFIGVAAQPPHLFTNGRYIDHFQKRNGEWRIANRIMILEGNFELSDNRALAHMPPAYREGEVKPAARDRKDASYQRPVRPRKPRPPTM